MQFIVLYLLLYEAGFLWYDSSLSRISEKILEQVYAEGRNVYQKSSVNILDKKENCLSVSFEIIIYLNYHSVVTVLQIWYFHLHFIHSVLQKCLSNCLNAVVCINTSLGNCIEGQKQNFRWFSDPNMNMYVQKILVPRLWKKDWKYRRIQLSVSVRIWKTHEKSYYAFVLHLLLVLFGLQNRGREYTGDFFVLSVVLGSIPLH